MPIERTASVEDMVGNLWRLGRTPSQAEFEQFFSNIAQVGSHQNLAAVAAQAQAAGVANGGVVGGVSGEDLSNAAGSMGIPRVASIDLLRKMIMNQPGMQQGMNPMGQLVSQGSAGSIPGFNPAHMQAQGVTFNPEALAAGAFGAFAQPHAGAATMPIAPTAVHVGGLAAGGGGMAGAEGGAASVVASLAGGYTNPMAAATPAAVAAADANASHKPGKVAKPSAKKPAAKKQKVAKAATPPVDKGKPGTSEDDAKSNYDSMDDLSDSEGDGKGGKSTDEVRRQRRMLSNRESARRSRRRKLEHVSTLEGQIAVHKADHEATRQLLHQSEQRMESVLRENAGLKAEMERLQGQLREVAAGGKGMERSSSLQRITSTGNLAKSTLGGGDASPQIGGDDSPRGFVPFRSLQSYENLLSLQAQTR